MAQDSFGTQEVLDLVVVFLRPDGGLQTNREIFDKEAACPYCGERKMYSYYYQSPDDGAYFLLFECTNCKRTGSAHIDSDYDTIYPLPPFVDLPAWLMLDDETITPANEKAMNL